MARAVKPPVLQVLFEPWPASAWETGPSEYGVFAGQYLLDALEADGSMKVRGFRAVVAGCTTCRRSDADARVHWPDLNDLAPNKPKRRCPTWKRVEAIVKEFGGWKRAHYVELAKNEGLHYQDIPQRRRVPDYPDNSDKWVTYEGPVCPDRHSMSAEQRRMRV
jgi:hypothetical protein